VSDDFIRGTFLNEALDDHKNRVSRLVLPNNCIAWTEVADIKRLEQRLKFRLG
jgi:hypothetical protein